MKMVETKILLDEDNPDRLVVKILIKNISSSKLYLANAYPPSLNLKIMKHDDKGGVSDYTSSWINSKIVLGPIEDIVIHSSTSSNQLLLQESRDVCLKNFMEFARHNKEQSLSLSDVFDLSYSSIIFLSQDEFVIEDVILDKRHLPLGNYVISYDYTAPLVDIYLNRDEYQFSSTINEYKRFKGKVLSDSLFVSILSDSASSEVE